MLLVTDLDINDLYRSRASGSVRQRLDRRNDLFEFNYKGKNELSGLNDSDSTPLDIVREEEEQE
jgi:hypothetical protein